MYIADSERYNKMQYSYCGNSGLKLPKISLGLWHNFGGNDNYDNAKLMLTKAFDLGITHFDLANNYGPPPGSAEITLGKVLKEDLAAHRDELIISTKAGFEMWNGPYGEFGSRKYLIASLDQSLLRLGLDYVDIFYSHRPDHETPFEETIGTLADIIESGKALYIGISNYSREDTIKAEEILNKRNRHFLIHQPKYNMFDRWIENGLTDTLRGKGIGSIVFSPLAQGLLTDKYLNGIPEDSRIAGPSIFLSKENLNDSVMAKISKLNQLANSRGQKLSQMALSWVLRINEVTSALIGASKVSQIEDAVDSLQNPNFSDEEINIIESILAS